MKEAEMSNRTILNIPLSVLLIVLLLISAGSAFASGNLVENPSMEDNFVEQRPYEYVAEYWTGWGQGGGIFSEGSEAYNGDKSQEIRWDGDGWREFGPDGIYQQINSLQTGEAYWLSGWFKYEFWPGGMIADGDVEFSLGIDLNGGTDPDQVSPDKWVSYQHWGSGSFTVNWTYLTMAVEPSNTTGTVFVKAVGHGQAMEEMPGDPDCCCEYPPCDPPCDPEMCPPEYHDTWWESYLYIDNISVQLIQTVSINATTGIPANGANYSVMTITVLDDTGNPIVGLNSEDIDVECTGSGNIINVYGPTDEYGQATARIQSTVAETKTVNVTVLGTVYSNSILVEFGQPYYGPIWYVDTANTGYGNGSSEHPFKTINDALIPVQNTETIIVSPGTYGESIDFSGKAITLRSTDPTNLDIVRITVIDSGGSETTVTFQNSETADSVLSGFTITGSDLYPGQGIYCKASPTIENCVITKNHTGISCYSGYTPTIQNCIISENSGLYGRGLSNCDGSIINCLITNNSNTNSAGLYGCDGTITNCTIANNIAGNNGGGLYDCDATITNCIIWGNSDSSGSGESAQIYGGTPSVSFSCIQDDDPNDAYIPFSGAANGNIDDDPNFINGDSNSINVNYRLMPVSPCIDAADNTNVPGDVTMDLDGDSRFIDDPCVIDTGSGTPPIVDMGAYENPKNCFLLSNESIIVLEGATEMFTIKLLLPPSSSIEVGVGYHSGDTDISVRSGTVLTFDSSNYTIPQAVSIAAAEDADYFNSSTLISVTGANVPTALVQSTEADNEPVPTIIYVDKNACGVSDGRNWSDAFTELRDALGVAVDYPQIEEVRVAQGVYTPTGVDGRSQATFQLMNGVTIKGGYAGVTEADPNAHDVNGYETILSGDLNGNDGPGFSYNEENSDHVVTADGTEPNAVLDGFTITAGTHSGGGISNNGGSPVVLNCTIRNNTGFSGAGMRNYNNATPVLDNCIFLDNASSGNGGGIYNYSSNPILTNCTFQGNSAESRGGGICNWPFSSPTLTDCHFINNRSGSDGGGMYNIYISSPLVTNCIFRGNSTNNNGGAVANDSDSCPTFINCLFNGNSAESAGGGALFNDDNSNPILINCTIVGNDGRGIRNYSNCRITLTNCVLWGNIGSTTANDVYNQISGASVDANNSCIQGWVDSLGWGIDNIGDNPLFIDADGFDNIIGTEDDNLRLSWNSPCIDTGDNLAIPQDTNDIDNNGNTTEQIPWDLDQHARFADGDCNSTNIVDMGSYEFAYTNIGDFDNQCDVDFVDFAIFASAWLTEDGDPGWNPDCDVSVPADDVINWSDLLVFVENWLAGVE